MNITERHIASKKRIGTLNGKPVVEVVTSGGLYMVVYQKSGTVETLGTGPHRAVARYIAKKREPTLEISELSKSDHIEDIQFMALVPKFEKLTDDLNAIARR
jgi:hypothetical protein